MAFVESPRFPESVSEGAAGGPTFMTHIFDMNGGLEQRQCLWSRAKHRYDVSLGIRDKADMEDVREFFVAVKGRKNSFRYKDWNDFKLSSELIGTGNGTTTAYQITKTYVSGSYSFVRNIRKPVAATIQVYVNDVLKTITTDYTLDATTGIITFTSAPPNTHTVKVTGEFDVPVRFDTDVMTASHVGFDAEDWSGISLVEDLTA